MTEELGLATSVNIEHLFESSKRLREVFIIFQEEQRIHYYYNIDS